MSAITAQRSSSFMSVTVSSGMVRTMVTPGMSQVSVYSSRGSHTVTWKPRPTAIWHRYLDSCPAPITSMR
ncbi:hypothetical protein D3C87_1905160 [compost metagenome]